MASANLRPVKLLRLALLVLLAAVLPMRGVLAGVVSCGPVGHGAAASLPQADGRSHAHGEEHIHAQGDPRHDAAAVHAAASGSQGTPDEGAAAHATCGKLCAAFCALTPLPATAPAMPGAPPAATPDFPRLHAAVPPFQSGAPERPPRTA